jgi:hypothetical protein
MPIGPSNEARDERWRRIGAQRQDADNRSIELFGTARSTAPNCEIRDLAPRSGERCALA